MTKRFPGEGQSRLERLRREGQVPEEVGVRAAGAVTRLARGLAQETRGKAGIERVQERPMVKQAASAPELGVPRNLPSVPRQVAGSATSKAGEADGVRDPSEDRPVAGGDVAQERTVREAENEGVVQAARTEDHGASPGPAADDGNAGLRAGVQVDLPLERPRAADHHHGRGALPQAEPLPSSVRRAIESPEEGFVQGQVLLDRRPAGLVQLQPDTSSAAAIGDDSTRRRAVYLDCAATTPIDPRVRDVVLRYLEEEFGNAGSRTHDFGANARRAVERARDQVAAVAGASRGDVVFTSGATESNNLALLGLAAQGRAAGRLHLVATQIEHHAVLEPLRALAARGFRLTLVEPRPDGWVEPEAVAEALEEDTLLVSVMHVNNETGVRQPLREIAARLDGHPAFFHVDAAQGFGRDLDALRHPRIDLVSVSGHKLHAPKGVGALIARRRGSERPPLAPLLHGGGQELGLRPGTLPVALIAGLGEAAERALAEAESRAARCRELRALILAGLAPLRPELNGDPARALPHILSLSFPGLGADAVIEAWQGLAEVSDGAACTTQSRTCSHVLAAMELSQERRDGAVRLSWCHLTPLPPLDSMVEALRGEL
jgi:cysteine desulfurase